MYTYSQNGAGGQRSGRCRARTRAKSSQGSRARAASDGEGEGGRPGFTAQHQKAIIEHLLITKNSAPQKNYSHVPCKFFRQGACQAGSSCPFSHSLNVLVADQTPCKYFEKGTCKFGAKCANAHILPDGTRVNPSKQALYAGGKGGRRAARYAEAEGGAEGGGGGLRGLAFSTPPLVDEFDAFEGEVLVPSELSDLLTPKELKRRNSRPSSTSQRVSLSELSTSSTTSSEQYGYLPGRTWSATSATTPPPSIMDPMGSAAFGNKLLSSSNYTYQDAFGSFAPKSPWNSAPNGALGARSLNSAATAYAPAVGPNWTEYQFHQLTDDLTKLKIYEEDAPSPPNALSTVERGSTGQGAASKIHLQHNQGDGMQLFLDDFTRSIY
ncbi:ADR062Wp [Eremothecium gossypii ATCC 10895]|uniref:ADR062Wp n=1 Tax=Eremothecium gossypii (strain ATCC 10895 / CBS 109.51 / FGSC 9923 / NRRL Y-1056) TaxID=284811 RepID=Q75A57_EREGS|nr:ADR062Wp [Eremothecium gossypii ATCC 10895]AAS51982.1 ADR062Wp [Eremothecium gossypii ATCC 10895]AEY96282.1 FADR062Wp [Eremothecium gossypii FDAG1]